MERYKPDDDDIITSNKNEDAADSYYENLYNDLPKEVVELLMKTHPLMSESEGLERAEKYMTKHTRAQDADEVKKLRKEALAKELDNKESFTDYDMDTYTTKKEYSPKRAKNDNCEDNTNEDKEIEEDIIKLVKRRSKGYSKQDNLFDTAEKRSNIESAINDDLNISIEPMEDITKKSIKKILPDKEPDYSNEEFVFHTDMEQTTNEFEKIKKKQSENTNDTRKPGKKTIAQKEIRRKHTNNSTIDLDKMQKEKTLDAFFSDEDYSDDLKTHIPKNRKIAMICLSIGVCLIGILSFRMVYLTGQLAKVNAQVEELTGMKEENNKLKLDMLALEEKASNNTPDGNAENNNAETSENPQTGAGEADFDTYTVVDGDSIWFISTKVYGNGANYNKILEANGLSENSPLKIGQKLKIPKL